jgi:TonB-dependent starch-binding outer membrane protein SusC
MKNNPNTDILLLKNVKKLLLTMKISFLFLILTMMNAYSISIFSQNGKVSINMQDVTVREIVSEIERQGGLNFLFNDNLAGLDNYVSVSHVDQPIKNVLKNALEQANMTFIEINEDFVVLLSNEKAFSQQQITVTGRVVDQDGQSLPGVSIVIQGTSTGTVTNAVGEYTLQNVFPDAILIFSFVGMTTRHFPVDGRTTINVTLIPETIGLEEVVAIGYGTRLAGEVTGAVSTTSRSDITNMHAISSSEVLRGSVSGISISQRHTPGSEASVLIRGLGTINDNAPLWVVDGVPGGIVNPDDIESISVLKDAAAQAIYGARASNGVIVVTTRSGRLNQPVRIDANIRRGISQNVRQWDMLNTREYAEMLWLAAANDGITGYSHVQYGSGSTPVIPEYIFPAGASSADYSLYDDQFEHENGKPRYIIMKANQEGTNWMDATTQTALYQDYSLNLSGGTENTNYAFRVGYLEEEGILIHTGYERYSLRSNIITRPAEWLEVGKMIGMNYAVTAGRMTDHDEYSSISLAYRMHAIVPVYDIMGNHAGTLAEGTGNGRNPVLWQWMQQHDRDNELRSTGNIYAEATMLPGLSFRSLFGFNYRSRDRNHFRLPERARTGDLYNQAIRRTDFGLQWNWSNTLQYTSSFADVHRITLMAGAEAIDNMSRWHGGQRLDFFSDNPIYMVLDAGEQGQTNSGNQSEWSLFSVFSRANYVYDNRYFLEAVVRRDGSSRFGPESRYGVFPAFSAGWRVSNEDFMRPADNWLNFLMLRLGYGMTGNDRVGNYNAFTTFASSMGNSFYPIAGQNTGVGNAGFYAITIGNPNVRWETTTTYNLGIDVNVFENWRLNFDLWRRNTNDMLYTKRIPDVVGQASAPSINIGEMMNNGFDLELGYLGSALNQELNYGVSLNVSRYRNEIVKLSVDEAEMIQGRYQRDLMYTMAMQGTAFPVFYGYEVEGIFQTDQEAANHPPAFGDYNQAGRFKFSDVNGDGVIDANDRTILGDPHPDFTAGLNLRFNYRGFGLATHLYGSYGNKLANIPLRHIDFGMMTSNVSKKRLYESWGSPYLDDNRNASMPKISFSDEIGQLPSSYFIEDASFLRMQSIQLSYNVSNLLSNLNIREFQIYGLVSNVFTITNYSGLDPEVDMSGIDMGIDLGGWPTPRRFMLGVNIGL